MSRFRQQAGAVLLVSSVPDIAQEAGTKLDRVEVTDSSIKLVDQTRRPSSRSAMTPSWS
ncbi:MAG: hypothetical protein JO006_13080 [Paucibacter sp.]|nr:hypothetical protein [Roseateles sp.]